MLVRYYMYILEVIWSKSELLVFWKYACTGLLWKQNANIFFFRTESKFKVFHRQNSNLISIGRKTTKKATNCNMHFGTKCFICKSISSYLHIKITQKTVQTACQDTKNFFFQNLLWFLHTHISTFFRCAVIFSSVSEYCRVQMYDILLLYFDFLFFIDLLFFLMCFYFFIVSVFCSNFYYYIIFFFVVGSWYWYLFWFVFFCCTFHVKFTFEWFWK